jgi:hypothetical protein
MTNSCAAALNFSASASHAGRDRHYAEMPHRHVVAIDQAGCVGHLARGHLVGNDLVAEKIEVYPRIRAAPFRAAQVAAVEVSRARQVRDGERQMKPRIIGGGNVLGHFRFLQ